METANEQQLVRIHACDAGHLGNSGSALGCRSTGCAIDPAHGAWLLPKFISLAQVVPCPVKPQFRTWPITSFIYSFIVSFIHCLWYRQLGLDLVPRIETEQVDVEKVSPVDLYRIHEASEDSAKCTTVSLGCGDSMVIMQPCILLDSMPDLYCDKMLLMKIVCVCVCVYL